MVGDQTRDLPMTDGRVLADRLLDTAAMCGKRRFCRTEERQSFNISVSKRAHGIGAELFICGNVPDRMGTGISVCCRIGQCTCADGIKHDQKYTFHRKSSLCVITVFIIPEKSSFVKSGAEEKRNSLLCFAHTLWTICGKCDIITP